MENKKLSYRLGIDLGATSLGWCMLGLSKENEVMGIIDMGVRIFHDGREAKTETPLSVARRSYRGQRRNLDRYLERIRDLIIYMTEHGLLPEDRLQRDEVFKMNPLRLRAKALDEELSPAVFCRALIHLARKRGFRSNRKVLSDKTTKLSEAIENLQTQLQEYGSRTMGEYLWHRYNETPKNARNMSKSVKFRYEINEREPMPIFPTRDIVLDEFHKIWDTQASFNPIYTDAFKQDIEDIIFTQRPLLPQVKGKCQLLPEHERAPKAHPLFQEFRILQDLNNLKAINIFTGETVLLDDDQHAKLLHLLIHNKEVTFKKMRKDLWEKEAEDYRFNLETNERKKLLGDQTWMAISSKADEETKAWWYQANEELKEKAINIMISDLDDEPFLIEMGNLHVPHAIANTLLDVHLPDAYGNLSVAALKRLIPHMRNRMIYSDACAEEGFSHSGDDVKAEYYEGNLPYYGELLTQETIALNRNTNDAQADKWGRINNPTVHIALNQLQKLVNTLCIRYGGPKEIVLELGKELKLSGKEKDRIKKRMNQNKKINEEIDSLLERNYQDINYANRLKVRLWQEISPEEIDRRCVYTGKQINITDLFSPAIQIDHILPKSKTYDDGIANKILCYLDANRYKKERSPWEAFGHSQDGYNWEEIQRRAQNLPDNKRWRFQKDAMDRYVDKEELIARMLNDTRYMSRVAMKYMYYVSGKSNVWSITGRHTALLRSKWGLNSVLSEGDHKERADHRHHAIDAFVTALTTRSMVKGIADSIEKSVDRFIEQVPAPYTGFSWEDFKRRVNTIAVSHKPDQPNPRKLTARNQTAGALAKDTAYGFVRPDTKNDKYAFFSKRIAIEDLSIKDIEKIIDPDIKQALLKIADTYGGKPSEFKDQLSQWGMANNVKKVKTEFRASLDTMIPVADKTGKIYKYYQSGGNLFAEIYLKDPTDPKCMWEMEIVSMYEAHQPDFAPQWKKDYPKGKKIMRLYKNDIVAYTNDKGIRELRRVKKMSGEIVYLREIYVAKKTKDMENIREQYNPRALMMANAAKAGIDIMGRVFDPKAGSVDADTGN